MSARLATLKSSTPEGSRSFSDLGRAATANRVLDKKTKELIAPATESAWITLNSGSIDYAELDSRKGTLILSLSPADKHTFTAYFSATRATDGRHMVPSGAVKQDKGLYAVPLGKGATRLEFNLKHTP